MRPLGGLLLAAAAIAVACPALAATGDTGTARLDNAVFVAKHPDTSKQLWSRA